MNKNLVLMLVPLLLITSHQCEAGLIGHHKRKEEDKQQQKTQQGSAEEQSFIQLVYSKGKEKVVDLTSKEKAADYMSDIIVYGGLTLLASCAITEVKHILSNQSQAAPQPAAAQAFQAAQPQAAAAAASAAPQPQIFVHYPDYSDDDESQAYIHHRKRRRHNDPQGNR